MNFKKRYFIFLFLLSLAFIGHFSYLVLAQTSVTNPTAITAIASTATTTSSYSYTPMEEIPGFGKPTDFPAYVSALYNFGLWTIGISAMLMIMIGGYMYLTSAGNTASVGKAKGIIADAIAGLILALVSYLFLYVINPDLVKLPKPAANLGEAGQSQSQTSQAQTQSTPLTINPNPVILSTKGQTVQLKVTYSNQVASVFRKKVDRKVAGLDSQDVTKEASYEIDDVGKEIIDVSEGGLVKSKEDYEEDIIKSVTVKVKYKDVTTSFDVFISSDTCPVNTIKETKEDVPQFTLVPKVYANENWEIGIDPQIVSLEKIKNTPKKTLVLHFCLKNLEKVPKIKYIVMNRVDKKSANVVLIEADKIYVYGNNIIAGFPYSEKMTESVYSILIKTYDGGDHYFHSILSIVSKPNEKCVNISPGNLTNSDGRIPLVLAASNEKIPWTEEDFEQRINDEYSLVLKLGGHHPPVDLDHYTLWESKTLGVNECKIAGAFVVWILNGHSPDGTVAFTTFGGSKMYIFDGAVKDGYKGEGQIVISHELGHAHGKLYDEYYLNQPDEYGRGGSGGVSQSEKANRDSENCAGFSGISIHTEIDRKHEACEYFREKIQDKKLLDSFVCDCFDVGEGRGDDFYKSVCEKDKDYFFSVYEGCNLIPDIDYNKTYWYREKSNGIMFFSNFKTDNHMKQSSFGKAGQDIFTRNLNKILGKL